MPSLQPMALNDKVVLRLGDQIKVVIGAIRIRYKYYGAFRTYALWNKRLLLPTAIVRMASLVVLADHR